MSQAQATPSLLERVIDAAHDWVPTFEVLLIGVPVVLLARWLLMRAAVKNGGVGPARSLSFAAVIGGVLVALILALPVGDSAQAQLLSLFGLLITAAIALSSTTFVGNAMAGLMLRSVRNFRPGDFVRVGEHFGRVSAVSFLHTEIQTEDRDLTTLSNMYLINTPVTVVRASGTIISATVSLGYDVAAARVEEALLAAAERCELSEPFVQIRELGDFSITYRVCGFLGDVKYLISNRTKLRRHVLDALHERRIEIVSPGFVNYRDIDTAGAIIPRVGRAQSSAPDNGARPEDLMFDKAEQAESRAFMESELADVRKQLAEMAERLTRDESHTADLETELERLRLKEDLIGRALEQEEPAE